MSNAVNRPAGVVCVGSGVSLDFRDLMKAERRHELETNDLAKKIIQAPDYFKLYGGRVALGVVVLVALVMLINYRMRSKREDLMLAQSGVADAREAVGRLASPNVNMGAPEQVAARRRELVSEATEAIDRVNERSEDPILLAQAAVVRGDMYWTIANLPELPGAATRPALAVEPKADVALEQAQAAYKRVLDSYSGQGMAAVTARFGLAAVAENQGKWDEARRQYQGLQSDANVAAAYKSLAKLREQRVGMLQKGVYLAQASTLPASTTQDVTPATSSVAPTTQPAHR
jgi:tetratricopeptide (TPR) repeat protein